jgi:hypothetical protein
MRISPAHFLKLSGRIVNTAHIEQIKINKDKYVVYLSSNDIGGFFMFSSGFINTNYNYFEVCKNNHLSDYTTINNWIDSL